MTYLGLHLGLRPLAIRRYFNPSKKHSFTIIDIINNVRRQETGEELLYVTAGSQPMGQIRSLHGFSCLVTLGVP
jgi:hypothetical protein